jgi:23S rRNA G2445 N2-methylase RlmL
MKLFTTCTQGLEEYAKLELEEFGFKDVIVKKGACIVEVKDYIDILKFTYTSSMTQRCGQLLFEQKITSNLEENKKLLKKEIEKIDWDLYFDEGITFCAETSREGEHEFNSAQFERVLGGAIYDKLEEKNLHPKVNLKNPDFKIYSQIIGDDLNVGVDFAGFDLNNRDYKIFSNSHSIKGDLGRAMAMEGLKGLKKGVVLDTFASDGVVGIETGLRLTNKSHNFYRKKEFLLKKLKPLKDIDYKKIFDEVDSQKIKQNNISVLCFDPMLSNIKAIQKNAKIAGIDKEINLSKIDLFSLDIKFEEDDIGRIITVIPSRSRLLTDNKIKKMMEQFFYQAEFILKKKGKIVLLTNTQDFLEAAQKYHFEVIKEVSLVNNARKIYVLKSKV